jgi:hypothetical protein
MRRLVAMALLRTFTLNQWNDAAISRLLHARAFSSHMAYFGDETLAMTVNVMVVPPKDMPHGKVLRYEQDPEYIVQIR